MDKTNMQLFDEITARVFAQLYGAFPLAVSVDCMTLMGASQIDDYGNVTREANLCIHSLRWLHNEGYVKVVTFGQCHASGVVLTAKGLAALKSSPESLEYKQTLGERIVSAIHNDAISTAVGVVGLILSQVG
jgi:hypothetical protein